MTKNEGKFYISLMGENSHEVDIPAGQGSFSITPKGYGDAYVDADTPISWSAFDGMQIPAGGHWPRFFYYAGNDAGFAQWSQEREIESFFWALQKDVSLDLSKAHIRRLSLDCDRFKICVRLGADTRKAEFYGKAENFTIEDASGLKDVSFCFREDGAEGAEPFKLLVFTALVGIERIEIDAPVCCEPFDCESLLQFSALKSVSLNGAVCNLRALSELEGLNSIQIRYCRDLSGPPSSWSGLNYFIAWNVEQDAGKALKKELAAPAKTREFEYAAVAQLRKKAWFESEFNALFTNCGGQKRQSRAYKTVLKAIKKASCEREARAVVEGLVGAINKLPDIETPEREDAYVAVRQISDNARFEIPQSKTQEWFDAVRDF